MALTTQSFDPQRDPRATGAAADVYGQPPNATRMDRMSETADVAADYTTGSAGEAAIGDAFIDGSTLGEATTTAHKSATINNQGSGFPGLANEPSRG